MRLLVIGGTRFVGRHIVEAALQRGHAVTLFNRGQSLAHPLQRTDHIEGDRETDLDRLRGSEWDAVVDTCGYVPRVVGLSVDALKDAVGRYVFISTLSVLADGRTAMQAEDACVASLSDNTVETVDGDTYGGLKVLCERCVTQAYRERAVVVRPGLVVGPYDMTDRFTYWPLRFSRIGGFVAPDLPSCPLQYVDGRDLGEFVVRLCEDARTGVYHAAGPTPAIPFKEFIERGVVLFGVAQPVWLSAEDLKQADVAPWTEVPMVMDYDGSDAGYFQIDNSKAVASGFRMRALEQTLQDTLAWWRATRAGTEVKAGLSEEKERAILDGLNSKAPPP